MRLKFVSRLFLAAVVVLIGNIASANSTSSFTFNTNGSGYAEGYSYSGWSEIYGASYSSLKNGGWNDSWYEVWNGNGNMKNFTNGDFEDEFGKGSNYGFVYGTLSNIVFNSSLDKLTGTFSGWAEIDKNGWWSFTYFNGTYSQKVTISQTYSGNGYTEWYGASGSGTITGIPNGYGPNAIGIAQTPEPSSLVMLGTGLIGIAGVVRRKLKV